MLYEYDFIKVIKTDVKERQAFIGATGVVVKINREPVYELYDIKFQDSRLRTLSDELGGLLWFGSELEAL